MRGLAHSSSAYSVNKVASASTTCGDTLDYVANQFYHVALFYSHYLIPPSCIFNGTIPVSELHNHRFNG